MSDWYIEHRQDRELEELRNEMSLAVSEASNLRSKVSQLQGSLDSRLQRLTAAFDAFVELSDIRYELIGFADAAEVRRHAGQVLTALASAQKPPPPGAGFANYWLQPAVAAIHDLTAETTELPDGPLSEAMALDQARTSTFLCLALAALGRRDLVRSAWLETAFGTPADGKVTRLQRALWSTGARGGLGAEGLTLIVERLREHTKGLSWLETVESRAQSARLTGPTFTEIASARNARARLSQLRTAVETIAGDTAVREPDSDLAYGEPDPDSASAVLRMLISEGSESEREPLARVAELRTRITDISADPGAITDPVDTIENLLRADLRRDDEPHLSATALRVVSDAVLTEAEELAKTASALTPTEVVCTFGRRRVTVLPDGPDSQSVAAAIAQINAEAPPLTVRALGGPIAIAAVGLVVAVGMGLVHPFWIVIGMVILGVAAHRFWRARTTVAENKTDAADQIVRLKEKADEAAAELASYKADSRDREASIAADLEAIRKHLSEN
jgi:phosphoglycolate phosphatase-like HAD superfamily hydrolase